MGPYKSPLPKNTSSSSSAAGWELGVGTSGTDVGPSGTEVLVVAASAAAVLAIAKPGVGASAAVAGASGATVSGVAAPGTGAAAAAALGALGSAEVDAPEVPTSAVTSAVAVEAPVAWTPTGTPSVVRGVELEPVWAAEELLGREALENEEKKLFSKK